MSAILLSVKTQNLDKQVEKRKLQYKVTCILTAYKNKNLINNVQLRKIEKTVVRKLLQKWQMDNTSIENCTKLQIIKQLAKDLKAART